MFGQNIISIFVEIKTISMLIKCNHCQKEFESSNRKINEAKKKKAPLYCSRECSNKAREVKIKCTCAKCGKELLKLPSEFKNSKHGNVFCNRSCACSFNNTTFRSLENNPNWKGGCFDKTDKYARDTFRSYKAECVICKLDKKACLQVHRIDMNRKNGDIDNLIILCANHHCEVHYGDLIITQEIKDQRIENVV